MDVQKLRALAATRAQNPFDGDSVVVDYDDYLVAKVNPLEADRMRLVLGVRYNRNRDVWVMPATRSQFAQLRGVFGRRLELTQAAHDHLEQLTPDPGHWDTSPDLYPFQAEGVNRMLNAGSMLVGDEMGTGKTIQAIEWMRLRAENSPHRGSLNLVVCPNSMKHKWQDELWRWWPGCTPIVVDGTASQRRKQITYSNEHEDPVIVINYDGLKAHTRLASWGGKALTEKQKEDKELNQFEWTSLVIDEAHKIKNPKAQITMAVKQMGLHADERLAMTGTPLLQDPDDVWSIMNFVAPAEWGSRNQFRTRYCDMVIGWSSGLENSGLKADTLKEFDEFFQPRFVRRTKVEVLPQLPEKFPIEYRALHMGTAQARAYKAMVKDMMAMFKDELLITDNSLAQITALRQAASASLDVRDGKVWNMEAPSCKLDALRDLIAEAPGDPIVVYAESRKLIELFNRELAKDGLVCGMITGKQGPAVRAKTVEAFQNGDIDVILGTLGAGAEGLTLTRANRIVIAQQSWSHGVNAQAIDRVHRIGQTRGVQPIVLVTLGTIDEATALADLDKEVKLQQLVRDPAWLAAAMIGKT